MGHAGHGSPSQQTQTAWFLLKCWLCHWPAVLRLQVEDLKRQYADRSERLRQAEAALADLKQQQLKQQQQQQAVAQPHASAEPAATGPQEGAPDRCDQTMWCASSAG